MPKLLPFVNKPLEEIEVIGNDRTGLLHLVSIKGVTPNENPSDFQEQQKKQQKFLLRLTQRIKQLAKDAGVPIADMRKRVMGAMSPDSDPLADYQVFVSSMVGIGGEAEFSKKSNILYFLRTLDTWAIKVVPEDPVDSVVYYLNTIQNNKAAGKLQNYLIEQFKDSKSWPITENLSTDQINKLKFLVNRLQLDPITSDSDQNEIFDYLDEQTADLLFGLQEDKARLMIRAATFMLKHRVVYPIVSLSNSVAGSKSIHIQPPQTPIEKNTSIRFGPHKYAETTEILIPGLNPTDTLHIDELAFQVNDGDVGFICQNGSRNLKIGFPDWTEQDTRNEIPEELISLLFNFYQKEAGIVADLDDSDDHTGDDDEGNLLMPSQNQLGQSQLTGETSTTDFNGLGSEIPDSTMKTLETSQLG